MASKKNSGSRPATVTPPPATAPAPAPESSTDPILRTTAEPQPPADAMIPRDAPDQPAQKEVKARLSVALNADGTFDLETLRAETREKLKRAVSDAGLPAALGIAPQAGAVPEVVDARTVEPMYLLVGRIEAAIAVKVWKIPQEKAIQIFTYSPQELMALTPPTARVLNKYGGAFLARYGDEVSLAMALLAVHQQKVMAVQAIMAQQQDEKARAAAMEQARRAAEAKAAAAQTGGIEI